eukprot:jgi/Mesvir1/3187/Mv16343-RA.1
MAGAHVLAACRGAYVLDAAWPEEGGIDKQGPKYDGTPHVAKDLMDLARSEGVDASVAQSSDVPQVRASNGLPSRPRIIGFRDGDSHVTVLASAKEGLGGRLMAQLTALGLVDGALWGDKAVSGKLPLSAIPHLRSLDALHLVRPDGYAVVGRPPRTANAAVGHAAGSAASTNTAQRSAASSGAANVAASSSTTTAGTAASQPAVVATEHHPASAGAAVPDGSTTSTGQPQEQPLGRGDSKSQASQALGLDTAARAFSVDGTGVFVCVLSDSFDSNNGYEEDKRKGELPEDVVVVRDVRGGGTDEGRAMLQIIYDSAPGARLGFHTADGGQPAFAQAILKLANIGCDVIVDDILYYSEPMFQDGVVAAAADTVTSRGVTYVSAAGNQGRASFQQEFEDSGKEDKWGCRLHAFGVDANGDPQVDQVVRVMEQLYLILQWEDSWQSMSTGGGMVPENGTKPGAQVDLDIAVFDGPNGSLTAVRADSVVGGDPVEVLELLCPYGRYPCELAIQIATCQPGPELAFGRLFKYILFGRVGDDFVVVTGGEVAPPEVAYSSSASATNDTTGPKSNRPRPLSQGWRASTLFGHANAKNAIAVGATFFAYSPAYGVDPPVLERFSSAGGTPIFYRKSGREIPFTDRDRRGIIRKKPEVVGIDGINTSFFGDDVIEDPDYFPNFFGTSAAAPSVAAAVALMLQAAANNRVPATASASSSSTGDGCPTSGNGTAVAGNGMLPTARQVEGAHARAQGNYTGVARHDTGSSNPTQAASIKDSPARGTGGLEASMGASRLRGGGHLSAALAHSTIGRATNTLDLQSNVAEPPQPLVGGVAERSSSESLSQVQEIARVLEKLATAPDTPCKPQPRKLEPLAIVQILEETAIDIRERSGSVDDLGEGFDYDSGWGLVDGMRAVSAAATQL